MARFASLSTTVVGSFLDVQQGIGEGDDPELRGFRFYCGDWA